MATHSPRHAANIAGRLAKSLLAMFAACLAACSSGPDFRIDGTVEGLGTQNLRLVYYDNDAIQQVNAPAVDSHFTMTGRTDAPTLVWVYNNTGTLLGRLIVDRGDAIEATLSAKNPLEIKVKGNDDATLLAKFLRDNATLLNRIGARATTSTARHRAGTSTATAADQAALNQAVESFVKKNRKSVAAAAVLAEFYNPAAGSQAKATELLELIPAEYRPAAITASLISLVAATEYPDSLLAARQSPLRQGIRVFSAAGKADTVAARAGTISLLMFTTDGSRRADSVASLVESVAMLPDTQIADISIDPDTTTWRRSLADQGTDPATRYWLPGGVAAPGAASLRITNDPFFVVADPSGRIVYRGPAASMALKASQPATRR